MSVYFVYIERQVVEWQYTARSTYLNHQSHIVIDDGFHIISHMLISNSFRFFLFKDSFMNKVCQIIINISLITTCYLYFKNFHLPKNPVTLKLIKAMKMSYFTG